MGSYSPRRRRVLILVLVDVGLGLVIVEVIYHPKLVLILVLVDVGLGPSEEKPVEPEKAPCLNPCFSGCWSRTLGLDRLEKGQKCLNPCFSGCWSRTSEAAADRYACLHVLILVLVDVGLGLQ